MPDTTTATTELLDAIRIFLEQGNLEEARLHPELADLSADDDEARRDPRLVAILRDALLKEATGQELSATPMLEYFEPLMEWLKKENQGREVGW